MSYATVRVVAGGDDAFNAMIYPDQLDVNRNYFMNNIQQLSTLVTNTASDFYQKTQQLFEQVNSSEAMRVAKNALKAVNSLFTRDVVMELIDIEKMQLAKPVMQRFIMANPEILTRYREGTIDGYSDSYVDVNKGDIGRTHYDYRRVMDGVLLETEDSYQVNYYPDELRENEIVITHDDKVSIMNTWENLLAFIEQGLDPTNQYA